MGQSIPISREEFNLLCRFRNQKDVNIVKLVGYKDLFLPPHEMKEISRQATANRKLLRVVQDLVEQGLLCEFDQREIDSGVLHVFRITKRGEQAISDCESKEVK